MHPEKSNLQTAIWNYLESRPRIIRWREWLSGRRYRLAPLRDRTRPLYVIAYNVRDDGRSGEMARALERDWIETPAHSREKYDEILFRAPQLVIIQLDRTNLCGCLGHRHVSVREVPFAMPHDVFGGEHAGEMDIAFERVRAWQALPLSDTALDAKFLHGSRLNDFHAKQFRLRLLSVVLHETNHLVSPNEPETSVRERSLNFYRDALTHYTENAIATLSLTIDRSFSRLE
ncbi:MAG TPA: hypothetical protein VFC10_17510 [Terriglobia bacterium]|jgi:hypothetical protein|nr:hypothetical protein [Terriglobia bacterium]